MPLWEFVVNALVAIAAGAGGGVITAGAITRRSERVRTRIAAEATIRGVVVAYRATMRFDHDQIAETSAYSSDYTSVSGQEAFVAALLPALDALPPRTAARIRSQLRLLLGQLTLDLAEHRVHVPADRLDPERESKRRALALMKILKADEQYEGILSRMLESQNNSPEHNANYEQAIQALDRILTFIPAR